MPNKGSRLINAYREVAKINAPRMYFWERGCGILSILLQIHIRNYCLDFLMAQPLRQIKIHH